MFKDLLKTATPLTKSEQKKINGGQYTPILCRTRRDCFDATGEYAWACSASPGFYGYCIPL